MRFLSTRTNANEVDKHKIKGKSGCEAHEQHQLKLLSAQKRDNEVPRHKIKCKLCWIAQEQRQIRLLSTRTDVNHVISTRTWAKEVKKHINNDN